MKLCAYIYFEKKNQKINQQSSARLKIVALIFTHAA